MQFRTPAMSFGSFLWDFVSTALRRKDVQSATWLVMNRALSRFVRRAGDLGWLLIPFERQGARGGLDRLQRGDILCHGSSQFGEFPRVNQHPILQRPNALVICIDGPIEVASYSGAGGCQFAQ